MCSLTVNAPFYTYRFTAMNCPCEMIVESNTPQSRLLVEQAIAEVKRIEHKYSRYRDDNIVAAINSSHGKTIQLDEETNLLLLLANTAYEQSEGLFDITSGVFRKIWDFRKKTFPNRQQVRQILKLVGWHKVNWSYSEKTLCLPENMQIDFGGLGKEYAVDKALQVFGGQDFAVLVNLGGDIACNFAPKSQPFWSLGVDNPQKTGRECVGVLKLSSGAVATSGDARNYLVHKGKRYGHIIHPKTGYPVENAPQSVTVQADTCTEAGLYSTLAVLHGEKAEAFLQQTGLSGWLVYVG